MAVGTAVTYGADYALTSIGTKVGQLAEAEKTPAILAQLRSMAADMLEIIGELDRVAIR